MEFVTTRTGTEANPTLCYSLQAEHPIPVTRPSHLDVLFGQPLLLSQWHPFLSACLRQDGSLCLVICKIPSMQFERCLMCAVTCIPPAPFCFRETLASPDTSLFHIRQSWRSRSENLIAAGHRQMMECVQPLASPAMWTSSFDRRFPRLGSGRVGSRYPVTGDNSKQLLITSSELSLLPL